MSNQTAVLEREEKIPVTDKVELPNTNAKQLEGDCDNFIQTQDTIKMLEQDIKEAKEQDDNYLLAKEKYREVAELRKKVKANEKIRDLTERLKTQKERSKDLLLIVRQRLKDEQLNLFSYNNYNFRVAEIIKSKKIRVARVRRKKKF